MKSINKLTSLAMLTLAVASCTEQYNRDLNLPKPEEVALSEHLNSFDALKTYVTGQAGAPFRLGVYLPPDDFLSKGLPYSMVCTNFQVLEVGNFYTPLALTDESGAFDFSTLEKFAQEAGAAGLTLYGGVLLSHREQRAAYLNGLLAPDTILGERESGTMTIADFEADALEKTYPMTNGSTATVVADPAGGAGHVLNVGNTETPANQSFPKIDVTLPDGLTLGRCVSLIMDFYGTGSTGLYGQGMRMGLNNNENVGYSSPSGFGCSDGAWGRDVISLAFSALNLTDEEKALTSFTLKFGSATGSGNYYLDNVRIYWEIGDGDQIIEKTDAEKKEILVAELAKWIGGIVNAGDESVKAWSIVDEPLDENPPDDNTFQWENYLGEPGYARTAVKLARDTAATPIDLFVSCTFEQDNSPAIKAENLTTLINEWEADNVTKIDGINALLHLTYSKNPQQQQANEEAVESLLTMLAESGKQIRISDLKMSISNAEGVALRAAEATADDRRLAADYYTFVLKKYFAAVAKDKQYGISFAQMSETPDGVVVCPWNVNSNRTELYVGIVNGLKQE
jgi:hypothetical protein